MTDLYGIIAHPVTHSLSPAMHNAAFNALGIDARFDAFDVPPEQLASFLAQRTEVKGFAVSIPHKETVGAWLDVLDPIAQKIGAVNTVFWKEGKRWGANTDAPGFLDALRPAMPELQGRSALVLGAGGAARAIVAALTMEGTHVTVLNRTVEKAQALAQAFGVTPVTSWEEILQRLDLIVNATSLGLHPETEIDLVPPDCWNSELVAFDAVYRSHATTRFIEQARAAGALTIEGRAMLLHQGARQFELWTDQKAPLEVMEKALKA